MDILVANEPRVARVLGAVGALAGLRLLGFDAVSVVLGRRIGLLGGRVGRARFHRGENAVLAQKDAVLGVDSHNARLLVREIGLAEQLVEVGVAGSVGHEEAKGLGSGDDSFCAVLGVGGEEASLGVLGAPKFSLGGAAHLHQRVSALGLDELRVVMSPVLEGVSLGKHGLVELGDGDRISRLLHAENVEV